MLRSRTDPRWTQVALADLDRVLVDHAHCEKKAAAQSMALVSAYPERPELVRRLSALAIEELRHFRTVHRELCRRGLRLGRDPGDPYARALQELVRRGSTERCVDRLLVAGLIEARSHERLELLAEAVEDESLGRIYRSLARAETGHAALFVDLAERSTDAEDVRARLGDLASREAEIVSSLPLEPRIH